jgi:hypothetical protein
VTTFAANGNAFVIKHASGKTSGVMAHPAILGSGDVIYRLAYGRRTVVAGDAIAGDIHVIKDRRTKRCSGMAKVAILVSGHMVYRRILTGGVLTVVTTFACIGNVLVVKHTGGKTRGVMTYPTIRGSGNVIYRFINGRRAVMAADAITSDALVTEDRWTKRRGRVAKMAILVGWHMDHRRIFTSSKYAIVTAFATPGNTLMIKYRRNKSIPGDMTETAVILCWNMRVRLTIGYDTVMAGLAVVKGVYVVERSSHKRSRVEVTDRAILCGWQVILGKS